MLRPGVPVSLKNISFNYPENILLFAGVVVEVKDPTKYSFNISVRWNILGDVQGFKEKELTINTKLGKTLYE